MHAISPKVLSKQQQQQQKTSKGGTNYINAISISANWFPLSILSFFLLVL